MKNKRLLIGLLETLKKHPDAASTIMRIKKTREMLEKEEKKRLQTLTDDELFNYEIKKLREQDEKMKSELIDKQLKERRGELKPKRIGFMNKVLLDLKCGYDMPIDSSIQDSDLYRPSFLAKQDLMLPSVHCEISYVGQDTKNLKNEDTTTSSSSTQVQNQNPKWNEQIKLVFTNDSLGLRDGDGNEEETQTQGRGATGNSAAEYNDANADDDDDIDREEPVNLRQYEGGGLYEEDLESGAQKALILVDGELRGRLRMSFFDNNSLFREGRQGLQRKLEAFSVVEFPLSFMEPFRPINMQLELPVVDHQTEDDLDIDHGLTLDPMKLANDPKAREILRIREYKKRLLVDYHPQVFFSLQLQVDPKLLLKKKVDPRGDLPLLGATGYGRTQQTTIGIDQRD